MSPFRKFVEFQYPFLCKKLEANGKVLKRKKWCEMKWKQFQMKLEQRRNIWTTVEWNINTESKRNELYFFANRYTELPRILFRCYHCCEWLEFNGRALGWQRKNVDAEKIVLKLIIQFAIETAVACNISMISWNLFLITL